MINPHLDCIQEAIDSVKTLTDEETDEAANTVPSVAGTVQCTLYISPKKSDQIQLLLSKMFRRVICRHFRSNRSLWPSANKLQSK
jgi:hypothetical protein